MTRGLPRASFNSSRLVRLLADLTSGDVADSKRSFAERLGQWLDFTDAISLSAVLKPSSASPSELQAQASSSATAPIYENFTRVRTALANSITADEGSTGSRVRLQLPVPPPGAAIDRAADFSPFHRYYLAHQRDMDSSIGQLRADVRGALSEFSPALKRLAVLDAAMDKALSDRERSLLATVPLLLGKRFDHLREAHLEALAKAGAPDDPDRWMGPGAWLAVFCRDMQGVLLAELEVRLQPVAGMIEALSNRVTKHQ